MAAPSENPSINHIITFLTALTDGDQPPASGSADSKALEETIRKLHDHASTLELRELGLRALGIVIYRLSSNYEAERTLRNFITVQDPTGRAPGAGKAPATTRSNARRML